jgi:hypothetical protein
MDFNATHWMVVAVRVQVPRGVSYLTPAGSVRHLFAAIAEPDLFTLAERPLVGNPYRFPTGPVSVVELNPG